MSKELVIRFNEMPLNMQIECIAARNGHSTTVIWKSDQRKYMSASMKRTGDTLIKEVRCTITTDKKYKNTKAYDNHEHTGNWMEHVECEADGVARHKTTGKYYLEVYPIKSADGKILNGMEVHWYLNGIEVCPEVAKSYLIGSKQSSSVTDFFCIPFDNIEYISGMEKMILDN